MAKKSTTDEVTKDELNRRIYQALLQRYPVGQFVNVFECPSANAGGRRCDLISFGVWKSTGNKAIGHEIKVDRGDWLRELQAPEKSDAFVPFVDAWYLVAPPGVVKAAELRSHWGLLELSRGDMLRVRRQATPQESLAMNRNMLAAILRRVTAKVDEEQIQGRINQAVQQARTQFEQNSSYREQNLKRDYEKLKQRVEAFEKRTGISFHAYGDYGDESLGKAVKAVRHRTPAELLSTYESLQNAFARTAKDVEEVLTEIKQIVTPASTDNGSSDIAEI